MLTINGKVIPITNTVYGDTRYDVEKASSLINKDVVNTIVYRPGSLAQPETIIKVLDHIKRFNRNRDAINELIIIRYPSFVSETQSERFEYEIEKLSFNRVYILQPPQLATDISNLIKMFPINQVIKNVLSESKGKEVLFSLVGKIEKINKDIKLFGSKDEPKDDQIIMITAVEWNNEVTQQIKDFKEIGYADIQLCILHIPNDLLLHESFEEDILGDITKLYTSSTYTSEINDEIKELVDNGVLDITLV